jgi:nucleoside-diphosphate-sugar epimerase
MTYFPLRALSATLREGKGGLLAVRVLVTGHDGYIGRVLAPWLRDRGHEVVGLDVGWSGGSPLGPDRAALTAWTRTRVDLRDLHMADLAAYDAVVHLAAVPADVAGEGHAENVLAVNHRASVRLATLAKAAGVARFLFASSCTVYGAAGDATAATEGGPLRPQTPYGRAKAWAERDLSALADYGFSPTSLRIPTVYGVSPHLRAELPVNYLTGCAYLTGEVPVSEDGPRWRPLVHVQDVARAIGAVLEAKRTVVHDQAFNVGRVDANCEMDAVAEVVADVVGGSRLVAAPDRGVDDGCCRVDFTKLRATLPGLTFEWDVRAGVEELYAAYRRHGLTVDALVGARYRRLLRGCTTVAGNGHLRGSVAARR